MTASGLSATDWYAPSTAMTAARDRARSNAADRREALIARDRFTVDPQDGRRDAAVRRTERSGAGTGETRKPPGANAASAARDGAGARTTGLDPAATPGRDATPRDITAGPRADRTAAWARAGEAGSARALSVHAAAGTTGAAPTDAKGTKPAADTSPSDSSPRVADRGETAIPGVPGGPHPVPTPQAANADGEGSAIDRSAQTGADAAAGTTGSEATQAQGASTAAASPGDGLTTVVDPRDAATVVPVVPVGPAAVPMHVLPAPAPQTANGAGTSLETQVAAAGAAASRGGPVASADASGPGRIDGDAKRDEAGTGTAEGGGFEGVLAQAAGDTPSPAVAPPDPTAAPAKAEASAVARNVAPPAAPPPMTAPLPLGAVPMTIGLRSLKGSSQFEIRLDPVDLGRIDVTLDIDADTGGASARLVVDRPETLALLQRDADSLQQALTQAGFDPGAAGISLSLRGEGTEGGGHDPDAQGRDGGRASRGGNGDIDAAPPIASDVRALRRLGGLDIRI